MFINLKKTTERLHFEKGEGDGRSGDAEIMPEQGGSRAQPGPSKGKGKEGGQSDKKEPTEGTSEKQERPRSCGEPIIVPPGGEGGGRQNILLGAELASYDEVKVRPTNSSPK